MADRNSTRPSLRSATGRQIIRQVSEVMGDSDRERGWPGTPFFSPLTAAFSRTQALNFWLEVSAPRLLQSGA